MEKPTEVAKMKLEEVREVYIQEDDCCSGNGFQVIKIFTQDGGGCPYVVIETDRWAMDIEQIDDFVNKLKAIVQRIQKD